MIANWVDLAAEHATTFLLGAGVGFILSNRYRITRRNGDSPTREDLKRKVS